MSLITSHLGLYENASFLEAIHLKPNDILFLVPILIPTAGENLLLYSEKDYSIVSSAAGATSFFSPPCVFQSVSSRALDVIQWREQELSGVLKRLVPLLGTRAQPEDREREALETPTDFLHP